MTTIVAGVPDEDPPKRDRLPTETFMHDEFYHRSSPEELDDIYRQREVRGWARYMAIPELKTMIEELGITSLAQFYTSEAKYDPDEFKVFSERILRAIERRAFFP